MTTWDRKNETRLRKNLGTLTVRAALVVFLALAGGACREEGPAERAGEEIDEALDDAGDTVDDAVDDVQDKLDDDDEE